MVKIKLNPESFDDYNPETKQSEKANKTFFIVGPSSVSFEKALVPFNSMKYGKHNQAVMQEKAMSGGGSVPVWATTEGMWFSDEEFPLVAQSEVYPNLITCVSNGKIIIEKSDGSTYSVDDLLAMIGGSGGESQDEDVNVISWN